MEIFNCKNVSFIYGNKIILQNLNFTVNEGEFFGIIGQNGSGKSTLLSGLLGLKKPACGEIIIDGAAKKRGFGYMAQKPLFHKYFPASVSEVVMSGLLFKKGLNPFFNKSDKNTALENMRRLDIEHLCKRRFGELSGGEQQRTLLARALCVSDKTLILDEPSSNLDNNTQQKLYDIINALCKKGTTVIMVSHDTDYIKTHANTVLDCSDPKSFSIF